MMVVAVVILIGEMGALGSSWERGDVETVQF